MRIRFSPQALRNLDSISDYLRRRNPGAAQRVEAAIGLATERLSIFPESGRRQTQVGVRKVVVRRYGYIIYYAVEDSASAVVVLAIRHPARSRDHSDK